MDKQFSLRKPCPNCPFRNDDDAIYLEPGRREEIIERLLAGEDGSFPCHKTVYRKDGRNHDEEGQYKPVDICQCPGAAALSRKFGRDTVIVQIATRLGFIGPGHYDEANKLTIDPSDLKIDKSKARI
jgi:hypothetical protein